jgi:hypothetical protein
VNDGLSIEEVHCGHDVILEFLFGCDADVSAAMGPSTTARSWGRPRHRISTSPSSVRTVFDLVPLRPSPLPRPAPLDLVILTSSRGWQSCELPSPQHNRPTRVGSGAHASFGGALRRPFGLAPVIIRHV